MKLSPLALLSVIGVAAANSPSLSISIKDGSYGGLDGLDPTLKWSDSTSSGDMDIEYGIESSATPTSDIASLPRNIWGKLTTDVSGWGVSARAEVDAQARDSADIEIDATNADNDVSVSLTASASSGGFSVKTVEATKGIDSDDSRITVNPRYNMETEEADVVVTYDSGDTNIELTASTDAQTVIISQQMDDTNIELTASADAQSLTISQQVDDDNRVAPTITSNGDISVEWERSLGDDSSLTATVVPNDSVDIEWTDGDWTTNVALPLDGTDITGATVGISRDVHF